MNKTTTFGRRRLLSFVEIFLWVVGVSCTTYLLMEGSKVALAHAAIQQGEQGRDTVPESPAGEGLGSVSKHKVEMIGRLAIPRLSIAVPVYSDFESDSLLKGIGHIQGTAFPGGLGNMGLAGHRDTYFRPLRRIADGMMIDVTDRTGTYHYQVDTTQIVTPDQVQVLDIKDKPELTLVTCYPFDFVGAAPKRFIVHAHLLSLLPDTL